MTWNFRRRAAWHLAEEQSQRTRASVFVTARTVPAGEAWLHEPKLDGYRLQVIKEDRQVRLYSRGNESTRRLRGLVEELAGIPAAP